MNRQLTLGSLFDGSGGFPLGAVLNGIIPVWASEIEPFPIRVTTKRLPQMKHYGNIGQIDGSKIEPVDIITFGSPCTDMSVAGKRAGLDGKQSVLFYEAIRIINEMRCATNGRYPRFILWENVPGAFSSNKGADFKAVLEAVVQIAAPDAEVPAPNKNGWPYADLLLGDGWSVAYRTVDAQFFGVAQRRKRIYLVADFGSEHAGEVLFESEGVSRDFAPLFCEGQRVAGGFTDCTGEPVRVLNDQGGAFMSVTEELTATLRAEEHGHQPIVFEPGAASRLGGHSDEGLSGTLRADMGDNQLAVVVENHPADSRVTLDTSGKVQTLTSRMGTGGGNVPLTLKIRSGCEGGGKGVLVQDDMSATLSCNNDQTVFVPKTYGICSKDSNAMKSANPHSGIYEAETSRTLDKSGGNPTCNQGGIAVVEPVAFTQNQRVEVRNLKGKSGTIAADPGIHQQTYVLQGNMIGREEKNGPQGDGVNDDVSFTLNTADRHAVAYSMTTGNFTEVYAEKAATLLARDNKDVQIVSRPKYIVRRLTPTECTRLQGFPDLWCDGLETPNPTEEEILWWSEVFEAHRKIMGTSSKTKSRKMIVKWLQSPRSDSAEYKMWGNGVALPCVCFALRGIVELVQKETE
ncbi:MAG: DNA cytosine methyltransferase [Desulfitobacterium hafniense]|nr:DNA cytosine methyltransferase [Desulfitobacterium hafniense]